MGVLLPLGIVWGGYTVLWYGVATLRGSGTGFLDLLLPQRLPKMESQFKGWSKS